MSNKIEHSRNFVQWIRKQDEISHYSKWISMMIKSDLHYMPLRYTLYDWLCKNMTRAKHDYHTLDEVTAQLLTYFVLNNNQNLIIDFYHHMFVHYLNASQIALHAEYTRPKNHIYHIDEIQSNLNYFITCDDQINIFSHFSWHHTFIVGHAIAFAMTRKLSSTRINQPLHMIFNHADEQEFIKTALELQISIEHNLGPVTVQNKRIEIMFISVPALYNMYDTSRIEFWIAHANHDDTRRYFYEIMIKHHTGTISFDQFQCKFVKRWFDGRTLIRPYQHSDDKQLWWVTRAQLSTIFTHAHMKPIQFTQYMHVDKCEKYQMAHIISKFPLHCMKAYYANHRCYLTLEAALAYHTLTNVCDHVSSEHLYLIKEYDKLGWNCVMNISTYLEYTNVYEPLSFLKRCYLQWINSLQNLLENKI